jgi:hypothetical protein
LLTNVGRLTQATSGHGIYVRLGRKKSERLVNPIWRMARICEENEGTVVVEVYMQIDPRLRALRSKLQNLSEMARSDEQNSAYLGF